MTARNNEKGLRRLVLVMHRYAGLVLGLPILILAVTGCALVFQERLDRILNSHLLEVAPQEGRASLQSLADTVRATYPQDTALEIRIPDDPTRAGTAFLRRGRAFIVVFVDYYTGTSSRSSTSGPPAWPGAWAPDYPGAFDFSGLKNIRQVPRPVDQISGQHDAHLIRQGLPGAGNLLVFDNQGSAGLPPARLALFMGSRVLEVDPLRREIVWQYDAASSRKPIWSFFSVFISSARRLPNGNTLICEGMNGRLFQVTREGEIVWEYVNPHFGRWADHDTDSGGDLTNWVYRAQPIPYDWTPEGTPRSENRVTPPDLSTFRVPSR